MADLTTSRSAAYLGLAYRVGREIVVMNISLDTYIFIKSVNLLCFGKRSQCGYVADLCLSAGEHCRTMYTRDDINFCSKLTDLGNLTAVRTLVIFQDHLTNGLLFILINSFAKD